MIFPYHSISMFTKWYILHDSWISSNPGSWLTDKSETGGLPPEKKEPQLRPTFARRIAATPTCHKKSPWSTYYIILILYKHEFKRIQHPEIYNFLPWDCGFFLRYHDIPCFSSHTTFQKQHLLGIPPWFLFMLEFSLRGSHGKIGSRSFVPGTLPPRFGCGRRSCLSSRPTSSCLGHQLLRWLKNEQFKDHISWHDSYSARCNKNDTTKMTWSTDL